MLGEIDELGRLPVQLAALFSTLAAKTKAPVVIFSRTETGTAWEDLPQVQMVDLEPFSSEELSDFMQLAPELAHVSDAQIEVLLDGVAAASGGAGLVPELVYTLLESLA